MTPSQNSKNRNTILIGLVGVMAIQIPTTIAMIEPYWLRAVFQVCTLLVVCALSFKVTLTEPMPANPRTPKDTPDPVTPRETPRSRLL